MLHVILTIYLFFAVLLLIIITVHTFSRGSTFLARMFTVMSFLLSIYLFGYLLELNSYTVEQMLFWNQIQYLSLPFYPVFWLLVSLAYTKKHAVLRPWFYGAIFLLPFCTFIVRLTNNYHQLFYSSATVNQVYDLNIMLLGKGPWYFVNSAFLTLIYLFTTYLYLKSSRKAISPIMRQNRAIIIAVTLPYLGLLFNIIDSGRIGIDYAAMLLPLSLLILSYALFKYDFLKLKALARENVFENSSDAMLLVDGDNCLIDFNPAAVDVFNELTVKVKGELISNVLKNRSDFLAVYETRHSEELELNPGIYHEIKIIKISNNLLQTVGTLIKLTDITARIQTQKQLIQLATTDEVTGLKSRRYFLELATKEFTRAKRYKEELSLLMIDIDHFKSLNDRLGHAGGDLILSEFGGKLNSFFRETDIAGRLGGEEFAVLLPQTSLESAYSLAENLRKVIAQTKFQYDNQEVTFTISVGVTTYNNQFENFTDLLRSADRCLYAAKSSGRNCSRAITMT